MELSFNHAYFSLGKYTSSSYTSESLNWLFDWMKNSKIKINWESSIFYLSGPQEIIIKNPDENTLYYLRQISRFSWGKISKMNISSTKINKNFVAKVQENPHWIEIVTNLGIDLEESQDLELINSFIELINSNSLSTNVKTVNLSLKYHLFSILSEESLLEGMENYVFKCFFPLTKNTKKIVDIILEDIDKSKIQVKFVSP